MPSPNNKKESTNARSIFFSFPALDALPDVAFDLTLVPQFTQKFVPSGISEPHFSQNINYNMNNKVYISGEKMICPKCGKTYRESLNFCEECGSRLVKNEIDTIEPAKTPIVENEVGSLDVRLVNRKSSQYKQEAKLADKVYKSYVTDGISRLDKVNGRFLASQTIKLDILIEQNKQLINQNSEIINLLKIISEKKE